MPFFVTVCPCRKHCGLIVAASVVFGLRLRRPLKPRQPSPRSASTSSCAPHKTAESRRHVTVTIRLARANSHCDILTAIVIRSPGYYVILCPPHIYENGLAAAPTLGQYSETVQCLGATKEGNQGCVHHKRQSYTDGSGTDKHTKSS